MNIPEGWEPNYLEPVVGDYIVTLNNRVCLIKDIFKKKVILANNYGEEYEKEEWRWKCEFLDNSIMDLDPQFGGLQKIVKI